LKLWLLSTPEIAEMDDHPNQPKGQPSQSKWMAIARSALVWFITSLIIYMFLLFLSLFGLGEHFKGWNDDSLKALSSWEFLSWLQCTKDWDAHCRVNPVRNLLLSFSDSPVTGAIKLLEIVAGAALFIWIVGKGSFQRGAESRYAAPAVSFWLLMNLVSAASYS
jgi:hypothetical protein